jgi:hypothetical protein
MPDSFVGYIYLSLEIKIVKYICHKFINLTRNVAGSGVGAFYEICFQFRQILGNPETVAMATIGR